MSQRTRKVEDDGKRPHSHTEASIVVDVPRCWALANRRVFFNWLFPSLDEPDLHVAHLEAADTDEMHRRSKKPESYFTLRVM